MVSLTLGDEMQLTELNLVRRSVTIDPELNARISQLRALCLQHGMDLDYTTALNLLAELGERWLETSSKSQREGLKQVWDKYLDYEKFENSVIDDWMEFEEFRKWKLKAKQERA